MNAPVTGDFVSVTPRKPVIALIGGRVHEISMFEAEIVGRHVVSGREPLWSFHATRILLATGWSNDANLDITMPARHVVALVARTKP